MQKGSKVAIIGSGFAGLASASILAKNGCDVTVYEKNSSLGGRARVFKTHGFTFDMGPSWYWMPEVFEDFFQLFGRTTSDFYELKRLDPSYRVFFSDSHEDVPADEDELYRFFEKHEKGSAEKLKAFLKDAEYKYTVGMNEFVWKPSDSVLEFADMRILKSMFKLQMFSSLSKEVKSNFKNQKLIEILEFPVLFLGAKPMDTPALYSLMNFADLKLGTWYPLGGMHEVIKAMVEIAESQGVKFETNCPIDSIKKDGKKIVAVNSGDKSFHCDGIIAACDYHHFEQGILEKEDRVYNEQYWDKRKMAPSSLLFYIGLDRKLDGVKHHNLFFDSDFNEHAKDIYDNPQWPRDPLFYLCVPSKTDVSVAPSNSENLFFLIPLAPDLEDNVELQEKYFDIICNRLEEKIKTDIRPHIIYKRVFSVDDFKQDYNSYKGNAYGLANTLLQTAFLKPKMKSKKIDNLFYAGQLTTPGPGVPPSLISGQVAASELLKII